MRLMADALLPVYCIITKLVSRNTADKMSPSVTIYNYIIINTLQVHVITDKSCCKYVLSLTSLETLRFILATVGTCIIIEPITATAGCLV